MCMFHFLDNLELRANTINVKVKRLRSSILCSLPAPQCPTSRIYIYGNNNNCVLLETISSSNWLSDVLFCIAVICHWRWNEFIEAWSWEGTFPSHHNSRILTGNYWGLTFSWSKCRRSLISRSVRFASMWLSNALAIFLMATMSPVSEFITEL